MTRIKNYLKSIPTRRAAKKEYNENMYEWKRVAGSQPVRVKRKNPTTYNKASTGIRRKK